MQYMLLVILLKLAQVKNSVIYTQASTCVQLYTERLDLNEYEITEKYTARHAAVTS